MATVKTNQKIICTSIEDARLKNDKNSNGVIITKDNNYLIVNYKTYYEMKELGYVIVR